MSAKLGRLPSRKRKPCRTDQFTLTLDDEDRRLLDETSRIEKLPRSDIVRRALRAYYKKIQSSEATSIAS